MFSEWREKLAESVLMVGKTVFCTGFCLHEGANFSPELLKLRLICLVFKLMLCSTTNALCAGQPVGKAG